jgi:hypothetical protein
MRRISTVRKDLYMPTVDFYTYYNQWIAPNTTMSFYYWWNDGAPDQYIDVCLMPFPQGSLPVVGRETHPYAVTYTVQNVQNYWVEFDANFIRVRH